MIKSFTNLINFMEGTQTEQSTEVVEVVNNQTRQCTECDKLIYNNELCSCKDRPTQGWRTDVSENTKNNAKPSNHVG